MSGRQKGPKHQNKYAWKPNSGVKINETEPGGRFRPLAQIAGVCGRCRDQIDWKRRYGKYKALTEPAKCQRCQQRAVRHSYHKLCSGCAKENNVCAKCCCHVDNIVGRYTEEVEAEQKMLEEGLRNSRERERRALQRAINKGQPKNCSKPPQACQEGKVPELFPVNSLEEYAALRNGKGGGVERQDDKEDDNPNDDDYGDSDDDTGSGEEDNEVQTGN